MRVQGWVSATAPIRTSRGNPDAVPLRRSEIRAKTGNVLPGFSSHFNITLSCSRCAMQLAMADLRKSGVRAVRATNGVSGSRTILSRVLLDFT